jgi:hypothetical protein
MPEYRMARVLVTKDILLQQLSLPEDAKILNIRIADDPRYVEAVVEHHSIPPVRDGEPIPLANPSFQASYTTFLGWGIE